MRFWTAVDRTWALLVSMRTSAALLAVLVLLLLLGVVVPQREVSPAAYHELVARGPAARLLLERVGLGHVSTSPPFRLALFLFFANLGAVLVDRTGSTVRRLRARAPNEAQLRALVDRSAVEVATDRGWSPEAATVILEALGYRVSPAGPHALWAVRHAAAILGFPLFHLSFFVLCAAGLQLYFTRNLAVATATEGQRIQGADLRVVRRAPAADPPPVDLVLERVDVRIVDGKPVGVSASLRSNRPGDDPQVASVNDPAEWGSLAVLVESVGLSPVLRLADASGFTRDRVAAVVTNAGGPATVPLASGEVEVTVAPIPVGPRFPMREALARTRLVTRVARGGRILYEGPLAPKVPVAVGAGEAVEIEELRYWASLRVVHERGGPLLVAGFALMVIGIVWRMVWYRREVAVVWDAGRVRLAGRGEFYPARFREELAELRDLLQEPQRLGVRARRRGGTG